LPRIKLIPLDRYQHTYKTTVEVTDLNYGNHMGTDSLVGIIHRARTHFLDRLGVSEKDLGDGKTGIVIADLAVNYKRQGLLFDLIIVESSIGEVHPRGFRMFHRVSTETNRLIALAETGIISFNYQEALLAKIPEQFLTSLENLSANSEQ